MLAPSPYSHPPNSSSAFCSSSVLQLGPFDDQIPVEKGIPSGTDFLLRRERRYLRCLVFEYVSASASIAAPHTFSGCELESSLLHGQGSCSGFMSLKPVGWTSVHLLHLIVRSRNPCNTVIERQDHFAINEYPQTKTKPLAKRTSPSSGAHATACLFRTNVKFPTQAAQGGTNNASTAVSA